MEPAGNPFTKAYNPLNVLVLYNKPSPKTGARTERLESEAGVLQEVEAVSRALAKLSVPFRVIGVRKLEDVSRILAESLETVVFNLVEGLEGTPEDTNYVPVLCQAFCKAVTGCDTECLLLSQNKWRTKSMLRAIGVPVPAGVMVPVDDTFHHNALPVGRCIVKPCSTDGSEGIEDSPVFSTTDPAVKDAVARIHQRLGMPALVEQFVGSRELNVSILENNGNVEVLPIAEIDFSAFESDRPRIVTYPAKWLPDSFEYRNTPRLIPAPIAEDTSRQIRAVAMELWRALKCRDYARIDMRMDDNNVFILELNPNPDISPDAGFAAALQAAGIPYEKFVEIILTNALKRLRSAPSIRSQGTSTEEKIGDIIIRQTEGKDRDQILHNIEATKFFRLKEIMIAREVLDEALAKGPEGSYQSFAAVVENSVVGWMCFGPEACTVDTYGIHWIVVAPGMQRKGIGKTLMKHAENLIAKRGGCLIVIETSAHSLYESTRNFYRKLGYIEEARIQDFYAKDDDKIIYVKRLY